MNKYNCPSCSAEISFRTSISLYCVCAYCKSEIFLNEAAVEVLGKQTEFPIEASPLRLFSEGMYHGKKFSILGRSRQVWSGGYWNEWFLSLSNSQTQYWLTEFQGQWVMLSEVKDLIIPSDSELKIFSQLNYLNQSYFVTDIKDSKFAYCEGELPFTFKKDHTKHTVDLKSIGKNKFLSIDYSQGQSKAFLGEFVQWNELKMTSLNQFEEWS